MNTAAVSGGTELLTPFPVKENYLWCQQPRPPDTLDIIDDRLVKGSTMMASQLPVEHWHQLLGDPTVADAVLDRLVHSAHRLALSGESMRKA